MGVFGGWRESEGRCRGKHFYGGDELVCIQLGYDTDWQ
jgi:hypothetical protein